MRTFKYVIKDEIGIHARPAGALVKEAKKYESVITISTQGKTTEAIRLMGIMNLGVTCGQIVEVEIVGADEDKAYEAMKEFFENNL